MQIEFNVTGSERQRLVNALVAITGLQKEYQGAPSMAYRVGDYTVDKTGTLIVPEDVDPAVVNGIVDQIYEQYGFFTDNLPEPESDEPEVPADVAPERAADAAEEPEPLTDPASPEEPTEAPETPDVVEPEDSEEEATGEDDEEEAENDETEDDEEDDDLTHVTLSLPLHQFTPSAIERLRALVESKQTLLKKALDTDNLEIQVDDEKVSFPWFTTYGGQYAEDVDAYSKLVFAMARLAITQKRVSPVEKPNEDEKLAMRLFLIRLDFIGDEYKAARKILMRNFSGGGTPRSDAFKNFTMEAPEVTVSGVKTATEAPEEPPAAESAVLSETEETLEDAPATEVDELPEAEPETKEDTHE